MAALKDYASRISDAFKSYFQAQLQPFDRKTLWSPKILKESLVVLWWAVPAFVLVLMVDRYPKYLPSTYLDKAISEGIGPHLWNVIGTLGLFLVGLALLFPRSKFIAKSAHQVLINTYAMGGLSFGLVTGQLITEFVPASENIETWKAWLLGTEALFLVCQIILLNLSLWYLGHLMASREHDDGFLHRVECVSLPLRLFGFSVVSLLPTALLFAMKQVA